MPPLIAFAGALGGIAVARWAYRTVLRINAEIDEARRSLMTESMQPSEVPTLRKDPVTGAYRPG